MNRPKRIFLIGLYNGNPVKAFNHDEREIAEANAVNEIIEAVEYSDFQSAANLINEIEIELKNCVEDRHYLGLEHALKIIKIWKREK